jgi:hypothetical protein
MRPIWGRGHLLGAALVAWGVASCLNPTVGQVDLPGLDAAFEKKLALPAGKALEFAVHAEEYENSGSNHVVIAVTLLRGGAPVGTMSCKGFELEGSGCGSGATHLNSDCAMTVPAGGSDAIRVVARLEDPSAHASFKGLAVYIRD